MVVFFLVVVASHLSPPQSGEILNKISKLISMFIP